MRWGYYMEKSNTEMSKKEEILAEAENIIKETAQNKVEEIKENISTPPENQITEKENILEEENDIIPLVKSNEEQTEIPTISPQKNTIPSKNVTPIEKNNLQKNSIEKPRHELQKNEKIEQKNDIKKDTEKKSRKEKSKKGKKRFIVFILVTLILALVVLSFIFGFVTSKSDKIISGVSINGVNVSNLTKVEAIKKLETNYTPNITDEITLKHGDYTKSIKPTDIDAIINVKDSVDEAYKLGRSENNIFANNFKVISTFIHKEDIPAITSYNNEKLTEIIKVINDEIPDKVINASYKFENENLIIENGSSGYKVNEDELKNLILNSINSNVKLIEIPVEKVEADKADVESIYNEVHKEPADASFKKDPYEIIKEEDGIDFAITLDEAKQLALTDEKTFTIPLKITKPSVTVKSLPQEAFPDLLGTYTTNYASSSANRATNVSLATQAINGTVLMPGEVFSYNGTVGQRTAARGYKEAGVYSNGQVTTGIGGGICQVSSTLYNATLLSNLEIVARTNHMFNPGYVPAGQDATVSWGGPDFQFKNNRSYPIRIVSSASGGILTVSVYGLKTDDDYDIKVQSYVVGSIPFSTEYQDDGSLPSGSTKVLQSGSNGTRSTTYKIFYKNGAEVSRSVVSNDTYNPHNQIVARGTAAAPTPTPTPEPTPTPAPQPSQETPTSTDSGNSVSIGDGIEISY